jgi:hypothetical protein
MFSAGVNAALAQFFGIADTRVSNTPCDTNNIPATTGNIPTTTGNIPTTTGNIPVESLAREELPGKLQA